MRKHWIVECSDASVSYLALPFNSLANSERFRDGIWEIIAPWIVKFSLAIVAQNTP